MLAGTAYRGHVTLEGTVNGREADMPKTMQYSRSGSEWPWGWVSYGILMGKELPTVHSASI